MNEHINTYISICTAETLCILWDNTEHVKRVIRQDGEYTNNILRRNKFIMTA